jgi:hypothetical protein
MNVKKMIAMICAIGFLVASCKKDPIGTSKTPCTGATPEFLSLYSNASQQQQLTDINLVDAEVHSYSFEVNTPKTVCSIGYQSCAGLSQIPYVIEIRDSVSNAVLFSGSSLFDSLAMSYMSIPPLSLMPNHTYTVNRIQTNWPIYITQTIGRVLYQPGNLAIQFPINQGALKITSSHFYGNGGPMANFALPCIDLVYQ